MTTPVRGDSLKQIDANKAWTDFESDFRESEGHYEKKNKTKELLTPRRND